MDLSPSIFSYTGKQLRFGMFIALACGVLLQSAMLAFGWFAEQLITGILTGLPQPDQPPYRWAQSWGWFEIYLAFGIPLAALFGIPISTFVLRKLCLQTERRILRFAGGGALAALCMSLIATLFLVLMGYRQSIDPGDYSTSTVWGRVVEVDGIMTGFGWFVEFCRTVVFALIGAISGTIARLIVGPPRPQNT
jgi:hypothetical protein